jgi:hypothetical protein
VARSCASAQECHPTSRRSVAALTLAGALGVRSTDVTSSRLPLAEMNLRYAFLGVLAALALLIPVSAAAEHRNEPGSANVDSLTLTYPEHFYRRYFASCDFMVTGVHGTCVHGVVVANIRLGRRPELGAPNPPLPRTVAKFELVLAAPQPGVVAAEPTYPLSLRSFRDACRGRLCGTRRRHFSQVSLFFRANDSNYWAIAWIGKRISRRDYLALKAIVASIHLS